MTIKRRNKVVKRIRAKTYRAGKHRVVTNLRRRAKRATYKVEVRARRPGQVTTFTLHTRYL